ncbi:MAG: hypothetical protein ACYS8W_21435 [Planctomycetota bacterium]
MSVFILILILIAAVIALPFGYGRLVLFTPFKLWRLTCALRGLRINIEKPGQKLRVTIY